MIRAQVSLDAKEYELVRKQAKALNISIAEFVRRALRDRLSQENAAPWMLYARLVESGDTRSSQSIDEVVDGSKH